MVAYISCEAAERLKLADSAKLFALTFLLVTFGAHDPTSKLCCAGVCYAVLCHVCYAVLCHAMPWLTLIAAYLAFYVLYDLN